MKMSTLLLPTICAENSIPKIVMVLYYTTIALIMIGWPFRGLPNS